MILKTNREYKSINKIILFAGLAVLLTGLVLVIYSTANDERGKTGVSDLEKLMDQLNSAEPHFEIGYTLMNLEFYNDNLQKYKVGDSDLLTYPVYSNEITTRLQSDSPLIKPDYKKLKVRNHHLDDFSRAYEQGQLQHTETGIICLILKQVGRGKADSVKMTVDRAEIKDIEEIFDAYDLIGDSEMESGIPFGNNKMQSQQFLFGKMETGSSILIPLCITNEYHPIGDELGEPSYRVTSFSAYIPKYINFRNTQGKQLTISVNENLRPIYMKK